MYLLLSILLPIFIHSVPQGASKADFKIYVFVAETCPICQYYIKKIKQIEETYPYEVILVFPNQLSSK